MSRVPRVALGAALATPWLFIWQGLDFTDQGYVLTAYRSFFSYPELTEDSGSVWLTNLIGAVWDALFGGIGLVGMRALWALSFSVALWWVFRVLRRATSEGAAALGVLATSLFLSNRRETWFSYNTSTSLLLVVAVLALTTALSLNRPRRLVAAGLVLGALPFARLPNVLALSLLAVPALAAWLEKERRPQLPRQLGVLVLAIAASAVSILALIYALGHGPYFLTSLLSLFTPGAEDAGYGASSLLEKLVHDQSRAIGSGLVVLAVGFALSRALPAVPAAVAWALSAIVGALGAYVLRSGSEYWSFVVPGTLYWLLGAVVVGVWRREHQLRVLAFAALIVLLVAPLGSNNGIRNAHMGLWLAAPLGVALIASVEAPWLSGQGRKLASALALCLLGEGAHHAYQYTYRDAPRAELTEAVERPQLRAQWTTPSRAKVVRGVLDALRTRVEPGDFLLAYEGTPLLQYLTGARPYFKRSWLMGVQGGSDVRALAEEAPKRTGCLAVAVRSLRTTRTRTWPDRARRLERAEAQLGARQAIEAFLREHGYKRTWSNGFFEILEPPKAGHCR